VQSYSKSYQLEIKVDWFTPKPDHPPEKYNEADNKPDIKQDIPGTDMLVNKGIIIHNANRSINSHP
jgi:hypothetical protein